MRRSAGMLPLLMTGCLVLMNAGGISLAPPAMSAVAGPAATRENRYLAAYEPTLVEWHEAERRYRRDDRVTLQDAVDLARRFEARGDAGTYRVDCVYQLPGSPLFLLTGSGPGSDDNYGLQFFLVRRDGADLIVLQESRGMMDSWFLRPVFYRSADRLLILADTGAEYSWGLVAYEVRGAALRDLGVIEVAIDAEENTIDPLPSARVRRIDDAYLVEFHSDLVWGPGGMDERPLPRKGGKPHLFHNGSGQFKLVSSSGE